MLQKKRSVFLFLLLAFSLQTAQAETSTMKALSDWIKNYNQFDWSKDYSQPIKAVGFAATLFAALVAYNYFGWFKSKEKKESVQEPLLKTPPVLSQITETPQVLAQITAPTKEPEGQKTSTTPLLMIKSIEDYKKDHKKKIFTKQLQKQQELLRNVDETSITTLYNLQRRTLLLKIPRDQFVDSENKQINLEQLFQQNDLVTAGNYYHMPPDKTWDTDQWAEALECLNKRNEKKDYKKPRSLSELKRLLEVETEVGQQITFDELATLLKNTKSILKSFVPTNEIDLDEHNFITKTNSIDRLLTYAKLQQVIEKEKLSHIHLLPKFLVIKHKEKDEYIDKQDIPKFLDDTVKIYVFYPDTLQVKIKYYSENYELLLVGKKPNKSNATFTPQADEQFQILMKKAPFIARADTIVSNDRGDAVIIETEI